MRRKRKERGPFYVFIFQTKKTNEKKREARKKQSDYSNSHTPGYISKSISTNLDLMKQRTGNSSDITIRTLKIGQNPKD